MTQRRLYCDIDGVIYGWYDGQWQIRPYTRSFLAVADQFKLYWASFNSNRKNIRNVIGAGGEVLTSAPPWNGMPGKLAWIEDTGGLDGDWLIIEDTGPDSEQRKILEDRGILWRWVVVPDFGADVLLDVKHLLQGYLIEGKIRVPDGWTTMVAREHGRSIAGTKLYKGAKDGSDRN